MAVKYAIWTSDYLWDPFQKENCRLYWIPLDKIGMYVVRVPIRETVDGIKDDIKKENPIGMPYLKFNGTKQLAIDIQEKPSRCIFTKKTKQSHQTIADISIIHGNHKVEAHKELGIENILCGIDLEKSTWHEFESLMNATRVFDKSAYEINSRPPWQKAKP